MSEEWKIISEYNNYKISNTGKVKNKKSIELKLHKTKQGYVYVDLYKNNIKRKFYIHKLVANAFLPNPNNLPEVNHKDENKENNKVDNLEWCTHKYNINYGNRNLKSSTKIYQLDLNNNIIKEFVSVISAAKQMNVDQSSISKAINGANKTCCGYIWRKAGNYINER